MGRDKNKYSSFLFRITAPWEHIEAKVSGVRGWVDFSGCMIGYHIGKRTQKPHAHFALQLTSQLQKESIDVRIRSLFGVKGSDYSNVPWDNDPQALRYLFHDPEGKVVNHLGYTKELIDTLRQESALIGKAVEEAKKKASTRLPDYVLKVIKDRGDTHMWTPEEIAREMFQSVYDGLFHNPGNTHFENYINEVMIKQCKTKDDLDAAWNERRAQLRILNLKPSW